LFRNIYADVSRVKFGLHVRSDDRQQFFVMSDKRAVEITAAKDECVAACLETHAAAEVAFKQSAVLHRSS